MLQLNLGNLGQGGCLAALVQSRTPICILNIYVQAQLKCSEDLCVSFFVDYIFIESNVEDSTMSKTDQDQLLRGSILIEPAFRWYTERISK